MFCSTCGQTVEEGKTFCKACGAPVAPGATPGRRAPFEEQLPPAGQPSGFPPPGSPPGHPAGYASGWPPQEPPRKTGRGGLVAGIVAAVIIVLGGAGLGAYFGFLRDGVDEQIAGSSGSTVVSSTSTARPPSSATVGGTTGSTSAPSGSTLVPGGTVQTIPSLNTTTSRPVTTTTEDLATVYLTVTDELIAELEADDARIPELAAKINATAPNVPQAVRTELLEMADSLDESISGLYDQTVPPGFEESFSWLDEAAHYMRSRIHSTIGGIEIMWSTGKVGSANDFFNQGRDDRDLYRKAMVRYHETLPVD